MVITEFNENANMMLVVELVVVFVVYFAMNERAECRTVRGLLFKPQILLDVPDDIHRPTHYLFCGDHWVQCQR